MKQENETNAIEINVEYINEMLKKADNEIEKENKISEKKCKDIENKKKYNIDDLNNEIDALLNEIGKLTKTIEETDYDTFTGKEIKYLNQRIKEDSDKINALLELKKFEVDKEFKKSMKHEEMKDERPTLNQSPLNRKYFENNAKAVDEILYKKVDNSNYKLAVDKNMKPLDVGKNSNKMYINISNKNLELINSETNEVEVFINLNLIGKIINKILE